MNVREEAVEVRTETVVLVGWQGSDNAEAAIAVRYSQTARPRLNYRLVKTGIQ